MGQAFITRRGGGAGGSVGAYGWKKQTRVEEYVLNTIAASTDGVDYCVSASTMSKLSATVYESYELDPDTGLFAGVGSSVTIKYSTAATYIGWYYIEDDGSACYKTNGYEAASSFNHVILFSEKYISTYSLTVTELGYVLADEEDAYPDGDYHTDGFYYVKADGDIAFGKIAASTSSNTGAVVELNNGIVSNTVGDSCTSATDEGFFINDDRVLSTSDYYINSQATRLFGFIEASEYNSDELAVEDYTYIYAVCLNNCADTQVIDVQGGTFELSMEIGTDDYDRAIARPVITRLTTSPSGYDVDFYAKMYKILE